MSNETTAATFQLPITLHKRAKTVAKRMGTVVSQLIRESLAERIDYLEAKLDQDEKRIEATKDAERAKRGLKTRLKGFRGSSTLAPVVSSLAPAEMGAGAVQHEEEKDPLAEVYEKHAKHIAEVLGLDDRERDPNEERLRVAEAIRDVRRHAPLTYPPDGVVLRAIESIIIRLRQETPPAVPVPELVIDVQKIKTRGDVRPVADP